MSKQCVHLPCCQITSVVSLASIYWGPGFNPRPGEITSLLLSWLPVFSDEVTWLPVFSDRVTWSASLFSDKVTRMSPFSDKVTWMPPFSDKVTWMPLFSDKNDTTTSSFCYWWPFAPNIYCFDTNYKLYYINHARFRWVILNKRNTIQAITMKFQRC